MSGQGLFAGFQPFAVPVVPTGALEVRYGLSVDTVKVVAEATAAPEGGEMSPVELARILAAKFNMPVTGLRVFVDGKEVPFSEASKIPAGAKQVEFRQPASEKGDGTVLLPLNEANSFTVTVVAVDVLQVIRARHMELGSIVLRGELANLDLENAFSPDIPGFQMVQEAMGEVDGVVYRAWRDWEENVAVRFSERFVRKAQITMGHGPAFTCNLRSANETIIRMVINGEEVADYNEAINAGDAIIVYIAGETTTADYATWAAEQWQFARGAFWSAEIERDQAIEAGATELAEMDWAMIRVEAVHLGVKLTTAGRTRKDIEADILRVEFPELPDEDAFVRDYLSKEAPEALDV